MKRNIGLSLLTLALCLSLWQFTTGQPLNYLTAGMVQARAWTFSALQTFNSGADFKYNAAVSQPSAPTVAAGPASGGSCRSDTSYRFYVSYKNVSGETQLSPASSPDFSPSSGNVNKITVTRPAIGSNVNTWTPWFSRSTDGHAAIRGCTALGNKSDLAPGTTTFDCLCATTSDPQEPVSNTTHLVYQQQVSGSASAITWSRPELAVLEVCAAGCQYQTVTAAMAAITDSSATKRYVIFVRAPYQSTENISFKSYVSVIGDNRAGVVVGGFNGSAGITEVAMANLTTVVAFQTSANQGGTGYVYIDNVTCGTAVNPSNIDCVYTSSHSGWKIFVHNSIFYGNWDVVAIGSSTYYGYGNDYIITSGGSPASCWNMSTGGDAAQIYDYGSTCEITLNSSWNASQAAGLWINAGAAGATTGSIAHIVGATIKIDLGSSSTSTNPVDCMLIQAAQVGGGLISFENVDCLISGGSTTIPVRGIRVDADADHANWKVRWNGGRMRITGGGSQFDVQNDETTASFDLRLLGVEHSGTYTGAGTTTVDSPLATAGMHRLTPLATAPANCSIGDTYADTSGAMCFCKAANTWEIMNATGACV